MMTHLTCDVLKKLEGKTLCTAESCTGGGIGAALFAEATHSIIHPRHYAITAIDRYGNESKPLQWQNPQIIIVPRSDTQQ